MGAYAVAAYARPRTPGDLDIWVDPAPETAPRVWHALVDFGAPLQESTPGDVEADDLVFQRRGAPSRVDVPTSIEGIELEEAWPNPLTVEPSSVTVPVIGHQRDLAGVAALEGSGAGGGGGCGRRRRAWRFAGPVIPAYS